MEKLTIQGGADGYNTFAIRGSTDIYHYHDITTADTITVPAGARFALFSASDDFFARYDGQAAVVPSSDVEDGTGSELNPIVRAVKAGETISIIAAAAATIVTVSFYS